MFDRSTRSHESSRVFTDDYVSSEANLARYHILFPVANFILKGDKSISDAAHLVQNAWTACACRLQKGSHLYRQDCRFVGQCLPDSVGCSWPLGYVCKKWFCPWCRSRTLMDAARVFGYSDERVMHQFGVGINLMTYGFSQTFDVSHMAEDELKEALVPIRQKLKRLSKQSAVVAGHSFLDMVPNYKDNNGSFLKVVARAAILTLDVWHPAPDMYPYLGEAKKYPVTKENINFALGYVYGYSPGILLGETETLAVAIRAMEGLRSKSTYGKFYNSKEAK